MILRLRYTRPAVLLYLALMALVAIPTAVKASERADHTTAIMGSFDHNGVIQVLRHPHRFKVESADSYVLFSHLSWHKWGNRRSTAAGTATTCDYTGKCASARTRLVASRRDRCGDDFSYERMTASHIPWYGRGPFELPVEPADCVLHRPTSTDAP